MNSNINMFLKLDNSFQIAILRSLNATQIAAGNSEMMLNEFLSFPAGIQNMLLENDSLFSTVISFVYTSMLAKADTYKKLSYRQFAAHVVAENFEGFLGHQTKLSDLEQLKIRKDIEKIWKITI